MGECASSLRLILGVGTGGLGVPATTLLLLSLEKLDVKGCRTTVLIAHSMGLSGLR